MDPSKTEDPFMNRCLTLCAVLFLSPLAGCDDQRDTEVDYRTQLETAEIALEDTLAAVADQTEATVTDAVFELGVDEGFFVLDAVEGDTAVVYEVDAMTGERVEVERRRANADRIALARRHHHLRRRLAAIASELRREHRGYRVARVQLRGDDAEFELLARDGRRHNIRRRLADDRG